MSIWLSNHPSVATALLAFLTILPTTPFLWALYRLGKNPPLIEPDEHETSWLDR